MKNTGAVKLTAGESVIYGLVFCLGLALGTANGFRLAQKRHTCPEPERVAETVTQTVYVVMEDGPLEWCPNMTNCTGCLDECISKGGYLVTDRTILHYRRGND